MDHFINTLEIIYYNLKMANDLKTKAIIFNKMFILLQYYKVLTEFVNYLYDYSNTFFMDYINKIDKPSLVLLTKDIRLIEKEINIPRSHCIMYYNDKFVIVNNSKCIMGHSYTKLKDTSSDDSSKSDFENESFLDTTSLENKEWSTIC